MKKSEKAEVRDRLAVRAAVEWAGGEEDVALACDVTVKGVKFWIKEHEEGRYPLRKAQYWRVMKLAEMSGVPPWRLTGIPMPPQFLIPAPN